MTTDYVKSVNLLNLDETVAAELFAEKNYAWEVLPFIGDFIIPAGEKLLEKGYYRMKDDIYIAGSARVYDTAFIAGPAIIGENAEIRQCAFIRGNAIIGNNAVVGNSTELKNVVLFNGVQVPHYNYVGDSVLGYKAHMGAGSITSNVKSDKSLVEVRLNGHKIVTGHKKFGAVLGDGAEIGCNSVLNPGTVIGRDTIVYPLSMVRGYVPAHSIYKAKEDIVPRDGRPVGK